MSVGRLGKYQDGALCFPNPTDIAIEESRQAWPLRPRRDIVVSLGTGYVPSERSPLETVADDDVYCAAGHLLKWARRGLREALDARVAHKKLLRRLVAHDDSAGDRYHRFDLELPSPLPRLDDTASMGPLIARVDAHREDPALIRVRDDLIASSFFFELDRSPSLGRNGRFRCAGFIRFRGDSTDLTSFVSNSATAELRFSMGAHDLGNATLRDNSCSSCGRFQLPISFFVSSLNDPVTISLHFGRSTTRQISGFPRAMEWFVAAQSWADPFTSPYLSAHDCTVGRAERKRKSSGYELRSGKKRRRE